MNRYEFAKPARRGTSVATRDDQVTVYRKPCCGTKHRTFAAIAKCLWRRATWITGEGPYATLSCTAGDKQRRWDHPANRSVDLHKSLDDALTSLAAIDDLGCGGGCIGRHKLVDLSSLKAGTAMSEHVKLCTVCGHQIPCLPCNPRAGLHCSQTCRDIDERSTLKAA